MSFVDTVIAGSPPNGGGSTAGWFPAGTFPVNTYTYPQRNQAFRELVIMYHDEIGAVQAFPHFEDAVLSHTLHSGRDAFAINYGTGGIGAEVLANRLKVGPMHDCVDCKFEEFFLTFWAVGDPAMIRNTSGGKFEILGDYLFRDQTGPGLDHGLWGILRVVP